MEDKEDMDEALRAAAMAAQLGEQQAIATLVRHVEPKLRKLIHRQLGPGARDNGMRSTSDILNDALFEMLQHDPRRGVVPPELFVARFTTVAIRKILTASRWSSARKRDSRRREPRRAHDEAVPTVAKVPAMEPSAHDELVAIEMTEEIESKLPLLNERERALIELAHQHHAVLHEIAGILGFSSPNNARMALSRARTKLWRLIGEKGPVKGVRRTDRSDIKRGRNGSEEPGT